jgi:hypothetical protein
VLNHPLGAERDDAGTAVHEVRRRGDFRHSFYQLGGADVWREGFEGFHVPHRSALQKPVNAFLG